jgi:transcriptional regulator with XRE-family HTH domain
MYNSQEVATVIKKLAKDNNIATGKLLSDCDLNKNALSTMQSGGYLPRCESLAKIADRLNCSVDYLLGRTDMVNYTADVCMGDDGFAGSLLEKSQWLNDDGHTELLKYADYLLSKEEYVKSRQEGTAM